MLCIYMCGCMGHVHKYANVCGDKRKTLDVHLQKPSNLVLLAYFCDRASMGLELTE